MEKLLLMCILLLGDRSSTYPKPGFWNCYGEMFFFKSQIEEENLACFCTELNGTMSMKNYQICQEIWNFDEKKNLTPLPDYISDFM